LKENEKENEEKKEEVKKEIKEEVKIEETKEEDKPKEVDIKIKMPKKEEEEEEVKEIKPTKPIEKTVTKPSVEIKKPVSMNSLAKYELNLKLVQKCEEIVSLNPKYIIETSKSKSIPSIGKIKTLNKPKPNRLRQTLLKIIIFITPLCSHFMNGFTLSNDFFSSKQENLQTFARSIGYMPKKFKYQPKFNFKNKSEEMHISFFTILKFFIFVNMLIVIFKMKTNFYSDYKFNVLCLMLISVVILERSMLYIRAFMNDLLNRRPNYLIFKSKLKEGVSLNEALNIPDAKNEKPKKSQGRRFSKKYKEEEIPKKESHIQLTNMPEISSLVKKEFILKNVKSNFMNLKNNSEKIKIMTAYRNDQLMSKSPETKNFVYTEGQNLNLSDNLSQDNDKLTQRQKLINRLREKSQEKKDVIYFIFLKKITKEESESIFNVISLPNEILKIEKIFKIKVKKNNLKLEYFGFIDSEIITNIQKFNMDYENFIKGKFLTRCFQKAYKHEQNKQNKSQIMTSNVFLNKKELQNIQIQSETEKTKVESKETIKTKEEIQVEPKETMEEPKQSIPEPIKEEISLNPIEKLKKECADLVKKINMPNANLNIADKYNTEKELYIAKRFLEVVDTYSKYYNEEGKWKVSDKHKEYTAWSRDDGRFIVRKAEIRGEVDLDLFEKTMKDFNQGPKWNPMLSKHI
jgi:hypothetical protein